MRMLQIAYASRPFGFDAPMLNSILVQARSLNRKADITGALICRADLYLQLIEGPEAAIEAVYLRIARDDRHLEVRPLLRRTVTERLFAGWEMRDDPARSWLWTEPEIAAGAFDRATEQDILGVFARLAAEPAR